MPGILSLAQGVQALQKFAFRGFSAFPQLQVRDSHNFRGPCRGLGKSGP